MNLRSNTEHRPGRSPRLSVFLLGFVLFALCSRADEISIEATTNQMPAVQLRPLIEVTGEGVFLSQLSVPTVDLPRLRICDSPAFGKPLLLKRGQVAELARSAGFEQPLTNWTGPDAVRIQRRSRSLDEKETLQLLTSVLQKQYAKDAGELGLRLTRPWTSANVPDEPFALKVLEIPTSGIGPVFIIRFELETAFGEHIGSWQASLQAKVWREIWVSGSPLRRGDSLRGADLKRERRDMLLCREPLAEVASDDQSLEFSESVQPDSPILARMLRHRAIVHRGQSIAALVHDGALMITLKVEALEDGAAGQVIRVRNPISRRDLHGKVLDEQNILVSL